MYETYLCDVVCWIPTGAEQVLKDVATFTSKHFHLSKIFLASHFLNAKVTPKWKLSPSFGTQKKCPFPLNTGVPSIEVTNTKIMWTFFPDQILCPLNGGDPSIEVS